MLIIPAIDIESGRVARGRPSGTGDPLAEALAMQSHGATWIHIVDMDRAFGRNHNTDMMRRLARTPGVATQLGGGLTEEEDVLEALGWGVDRVVVGAAGIAVLPVLVERIGGDRLALGVDVREGVAMTRTGASVHRSPVALTQEALDAGVRWVVYRDLDRDGQLSGGDHDGAARLRDAGAEVVLAGGITAIDEFDRAQRDGLAGVIVGRAIHVGRFTLDEALAWSA